MNKFLEHIFVIPEDEADEEIANGFALHDRVDARRIQVMPVAGGWKHVLATFQAEYVPRLRKYPLGHVVMLIDFDGYTESRMKYFRERIPDDLRQRVFVVGSSTNPEAIEKAVNLPREQIGRSLAEACVSNVDDLWDHELLQHNAEERARLADAVSRFLFS